MMRGVHIPKNIQTMHLSDDARNVLTNLVLVKTLSLEELSLPEPARQPAADEYSDLIQNAAVEDLLISDFEIDFGFEQASQELAFDVNAFDVDEIEIEEENTDTFEVEALLFVLAGIEENEAANLIDNKRQDEGLNEGQATFLTLKSPSKDDDPLIVDEAKKIPKEGRRFFKRKQATASSSLKSHVGLKDVRRAFEQQTRKSPFAMTFFLLVVVLLVAGIPPLINLAYIQPTITDNNQKLSMIANFKVQTEAKFDESKILQNKIKKLKKNLGGYALNVKKQDEYNFMVSAFLSALERYDVKILSNQSWVDESLTTKLDDKNIIEGVMMALEIQSRFDVYQSIRNIFIEQLSSVSVIEEKITALPGENELNIKLKMAIVYLKEIE